MEYQLSLHDFEFQKADWNKLLDRSDLSSILEVVKKNLSGKYDINGDQLVHSASRNCNSVKLNELLKIGFDVDAKNQSGESPLHIAVSKKCWPVITLLSFYRADLTIKDNQKEGLEIPLYLKSLKSNSSGKKYVN